MAPSWRAEDLNKDAKLSLIKAGGARLSGYCLVSTQSSNTF